MAHEVRLVRIERRDVMPPAFAVPPVRIRVTRFTPQNVGERRAGSAQPRHDAGHDGLRAARGILFAAMLSVVAWALIGMVVWVIVH